MILMALQMQISSKEQHVFFLQLGVGWQEIHRAQSRVQEERVKCGTHILYSSVCGSEVWCPDPRNTLVQGT